MDRLIILLPAFGLGLVAFAVARIVEAPPTIAGIIAGGVCLVIAGAPLVRGLMRGHTSKVRLDSLEADTSAPDEPSAATSAEAAESLPAGQKTKATAPSEHAASTPPAPSDGPDAPPATAPGEPEKSAPEKAPAAGRSADGAADAAAGAPAEGEDEKAVDRAEAPDVAPEAGPAAADPDEAPAPDEVAAPGGAGAADDAGPDIERRIADPATYLWLAAEPDPELWHIILWSLEWDKDPDPAFCKWVVVQPECDRATAADLFLAFSGPELVGLTEREVRERFPEFGEYVDVIARICDRCTDGGYPVSRFRPNFLDWDDVDLPRLRKDLAQANPGPDQVDRLQAPVSLLEKDFPSREPRSDYEVRDGMIVRRQKG